MRKIAIYSSMLVPILAHASGSLCTSDEVVIFSCSAGKKTISYCGSIDLDGDKGYMQYRFGSKENIELIYPDAKLNPKNRFRIAYLKPMNDDGSRGVMVDVEFSRAGFTYILNYIDNSGVSANLNVFRNNQKISNLICNKKTIETDELTRMMHY